MQASLLVLALFALLAPHVYAGACKDGQFQCKDGSCGALLVERCDGVKNCKDGSDEDADLCKSLPSASLKLEDADKALRTKVQFQKPHGSIEMMLCSDKECNKLVVNGSASGFMRYSFYKGCNSLGGGSCRLNSTASPDGSQSFPAGKVEFVTMRLPLAMAVWLEGDWNKAAVLSAPVCSDKFVVKTTNWPSDTVTFSQVTTTQLEKEYPNPALSLPSTNEIIARTLTEVMLCVF